MNGLFAAWVAETVLISWRSFTQNRRPPLPSEMVAAFVVFGTLGLIADNPTARPPAVALGWGLVIATAFRLGPADFNRAAAGIGGSSPAASSRNPTGPARTPAGSELTDRVPSFLQPPRTTGARPVVRI